MHAMPRRCTRAVAGGTSFRARGVSRQHKGALDGASSSRFDAMETDTNNQPQHVIRQLIALNRIHYQK